MLGPTKSNICLAVSPADLMPSNNKRRNKYFSQHTVHVSSKLKACNTFNLGHFLFDYTVHSITFISRQPTMFVASHGNSNNINTESEDIQPFVS